MFHSVGGGGGDETMDVVESSTGRFTGNYRDHGSSSSTSTSFASTFQSTDESCSNSNCCNGEMDDIVPPLIDIEGQSALMAKIRDNKGHRKLASRWDDDDEGILEKDMNDPKEQTLTAAENGNLELLKMLISKDPSLLSAKDTDGYTALHRAAYGGHRHVVDFLLSMGADPEWKTDNGWTVLHCAAMWSMHEVVALLLRHGVDVNCRSNGNLTPLHLAITSNQPLERVLATIRYLLDAPGLDAAAVSNSGESPLIIARRTSPKITEMLTRYFNRP